MEKQLLSFVSFNVCVPSWVFDGMEDLQGLDLGRGMIKPWLSF